MIHLEIDKARNLVHLSPEGKLEKADFDRLTETLNEHINMTDSVPAIIIETRGRPHWDSYGAFLRHMEFIKDYHKLVPKIAIVSDSSALSMARSLADHLVKAKVRYFPIGSAAEAADWASASDDHPGQFRLIEGLPANVIGVDAEGVITAQDYDETLVPLIKDKLKIHDRLNLLFVAGPSFRAYSAGAVWDDARFGVTHLADFKKIAIVSDIDWIRMGTKLFGPLLLGDMHVFSMAELDDAKEWVKR